MRKTNLDGYLHVLQYVLPIFKKNGSGKFICVSPPIYSRFIRGKAVYAVTKLGNSFKEKSIRSFLGCSILTIGLHQDLVNDGLDDRISITSLWPATAIQSAVTDTFSINPGKYKNILFKVLLS